jgi:hypothetical protein
LGKDEIILDMKRTITPSFYNRPDAEILENQDFEYQIVEPENMRRAYNGKADSVIILFHGLNERSWDKYYPWASYIAEKTRKPVLLFPIAFHINRAPLEWSVPRTMQPFVAGEDRDVVKKTHLTFLNYALSKRIIADPYRFYLAGRESVNNVCQIMNQIRKGRHPMIDTHAKVDIFAYSIGALLAQVLLFANPELYFTNSRLFMFCGGSVFNEMNGDSKMIMDGESFSIMLKYYTENFIFFKNEKRLKGDAIEHAFVCHIDHTLNREQREYFYNENSDRIKILSLKKDTVIPTNGIKSALGMGQLHCLEELDFPFEYSHEIPFPEPNARVDAKDRSYWFERVFSKASAFLS